MGWQCQGEASGRERGTYNGRIILTKTPTQLGDKVVGNLLELVGVHDEEVFELLDLVQQILGHVGHGA